MWFEWYEESLLDARIWKSAEQANESIKRLAFSAPAEIREHLGGADECSCSQRAGTSATSGASGRVLRVREITGKGTEQRYVR